MIQYLITALIDIVLAGFAFSRKDNPAAKALSFVLFSLSVWLFELFLLTTLKDIELLNILFHITRSGMFFIPFGFALLTWRLVGSRSIFFKKVFVIFGGAFSSILWILNMFVFPSVLKEANGGYLPQPDAIFYIFSGYLVWCFVGSIALVALSYKESSKREKQRFRWLLITLVVSLSCGILVINLMPSGIYLSKFVGAVTNIVFVSFLFYSTIQHNLMDFRLAISLSLSRIGLLGFFVWLYFVFTSIIGDQMQSSGRVFVLLTFVVLILEAYPRLLRWLVPNAKKMLVKHGYEFDQVKEDTEKALNHTMSISTMFDVLDHLFLKIIRVQNYKILAIESDVTRNVNRLSEGLTQLPFEFVVEEHSLVSYCAQNGGLNMADEMPDTIKYEMEKQRAALCFAVTSNKKILAIVLVGASSDLSYYRYDDIKMFEWLSSELGQVLQRLIRLDDMQDQLGEAKKTLSMLGMMSHYHHDIKAPFAIIDGVFSSDMYDRDKQKDIVLAQVERGSKLIATMASILGGKRRRRVQPCAIEALVRDCAFVFETSIDKVEYELANIPKIAGDAEDLKILFINLIKNAVEARQGHEEIIIKINSWLEEAFVCMSIKDNGVGMTKQQLANLWEQDYSAKEFGSGIGMQAIKRIADEHSARIEVRSEIGSGTEFIFRFPSALIVAGDASGAKDELAERRAIYTVETKNLH